MRCGNYFHTYFTKITQYLYITKTIEMAKSKANSKLQNVKAVKQMLDGTHKFQTKTSVGYEKSVEQREIGDTWIDEQGYKWEQKNGFKVKHGKMDALRKYLTSFPSCPKETCTCNTPHRADLKMKRIHGMCLDCVIDEEHKIKIQGPEAWKKYERQKIYDNALAWLRSAEKDKDNVLSELEKTEFVNKDGSIEKWDGTANKEKMKKKIEEGFEKFKTDFLSKFESDGESNE